MNESEDDMNNEQNELRDDLLAHIMPWLTDHPKGPGDAGIQAVIACMGAAAVVLGALPQETREIVAGQVSENLMDHANQRALELRSGEFDDHQDRLRN